MITVKVVCLVLPTSNHNRPPFSLLMMLLYVLSFLHQTTTLCHPLFLKLCCMSCPSYIKPQRARHPRESAYVVCLVLPTSNHNSCAFPFHGTMVVCLVLPTSNHNIEARVIAWLALYVLSFLHQTTTYPITTPLFTGCMSCPSYIKPQLSFHSTICLHVVCLVLPTSNHNGQVIP